MLNVYEFQQDAFHTRMPNILSSFESDNEYLLVYNWLMLARNIKDMRELAKDLNNILEVMEP